MSKGTKLDNAPKNLVSQADIMASVFGVSEKSSDQKNYFAQFKASLSPCSDGAPPLMEDGKKFNAPIEYIESYSNLRTVKSSEAEDESLKMSIETEGIMSPIILTADFENHVFVIVGGHRRYEAYSALHKEQPEKFRDVIPAIFKEDKEKLLVMQALENIARTNFAPIDYCNALQVLMEREGLKASSLAARVGADKSKVSACLGIAKWTPSQKAKAIEQGHSLTKLIQMQKKRSQKPVTKQLDDEGRKGASAGKSLKFGDTALGKRVKKFKSEFRMQESAEKRADALCRWIHNSSPKEKADFYRFCAVVFKPQFPPSTQNDGEK